MDLTHNLRVSIRILQTHISAGQKIPCCHHKIRVLLIDQIHHAPDRLRPGVHAHVQIPDQHHSEGLLLLPIDDQRLIDTDRQLMHFNIHGMVHAIYIQDCHCCQGSGDKSSVYPFPSSENRSYLSPEPAG